MKTMIFKSTSKKTLAQAYNVSDKTLANWLRPFNDQIGVYRSRCFTPKQVSKIVELLGLPEYHDLIAN